MAYIADGSQELKDLIHENRGIIKNEYLTVRLFVDSAIRDKLRKMGVDAGQDEIVPHLERLQASKARHLDQQAVSQAKRRHRLRMARNKRKLEEI